MLVLLVDRYPAQEAINFALVNDASHRSVAVLSAAIDGDCANLMSWMRQPGQEDILEHFEDVQQTLLARGARILRGTLQPSLAQYVCRRLGFRHTGEHHPTRVGELSVIEKVLERGPTRKVTTS